MCWLSCVLLLGAALACQKRGYVPTPAAARVLSARNERRCGSCCACKQVLHGVVCGAEGLPRPLDRRILALVGTRCYGHAQDFTSGVAWQTLVAFQCHPEKSGRPGLHMLENFCRWRP